MLIHRGRCLQCKTSVPRLSLCFWWKVKAGEVKEGKANLWWFESNVHLPCARQSNYRCFEFATMIRFIRNHMHADDLSVEPFHLASIIFLWQRLLCWPSCQRRHCPLRLLALTKREVEFTVIDYGWSGRLWSLVMVMQMRLWLCPCLQKESLGNCCWLKMQIQLHYLLR